MPSSESFWELAFPQKDEKQNAQSWTFCPPFYLAPTSSTQQCLKQPPETALLTHCLFQQWKETNTWACLKGHHCVCSYIESETALCKDNYVISTKKIKYIVRKCEGKENQSLSRLIRKFYLLRKGIKFTQTLPEKKKKVSIHFKTLALFMQNTQTDKHKVVKDEGWEMARGKTFVVQVWRLEFGFSETT